MDITFVATLRVIRSGDAWRIKEAALAGGLTTIRRAREVSGTLIGDSEIERRGYGRGSWRKSARIECAVRIGVHACTLMVRRSHR